MVNMLMRLCWVRSIFESIFVIPRLEIDRISFIYFFFVKGLQFWIVLPSYRGNIGKHDCMVIMQMSNMRG